MVPMTGGEIDTLCKRVLQKGERRYIDLKINIDKWGDQKPPLLKVVPNKRKDKKETNGFLEQEGFILFGPRGLQPPSYPLLRVATGTACSR